MKEISRLKEMSTGLQKGSSEAIHMAEGLKMIVLNLTIQAASINNLDQKSSTIFIIEKLTTEIEQLKTDIAKIGLIGIKIGELDLNIENEETLYNLIEALEEIKLELKKESKSTFSFLEKLRYICQNLEIQAKEIGKTGEAREIGKDGEVKAVSNIGESRAISVIVKTLVHKIAILKNSALMVEGSSLAVDAIITVLKEQTTEKQKVKTK